MDKRGQLGIIEFKYFISGLFFGIILMLILIGLMNSGVIAFKLPWVTC
ncbi:hypothetical protein HYX14_00840 [Candidatus Woesearchaeota archaeon]|nr:hypothetical protein [Candidatus Woesearchaeota archaeon]